MVAEPVCVPFLRLDAEPLRGLIGAAPHDGRRFDLRFAADLPPTRSRHDAATDHDLIERVPAVVKVRAVTRCDDGPHQVEQVAVLASRRADSGGIRGSQGVFGDRSVERLVVEVAQDDDRSVLALFFVPSFFLQCRG